MCARTHSTATRALSSQAGFSPWFSHHAWTMAWTMMDHHGCMYALYGGRAGGARFI